MKTNEMTELQKKASEYLEWFENGTRDNGDVFLTLKDGRPEELKELVYKAHGDMAPDDYKYQFVHDALWALKSYDDPDDIESEIEADVYNNDLIEWLGSNLHRAEYVNEAVADFGIEAKDFDLYQVIGLGQLQEKREVFSIVRSELEGVL